MTLLDKKKRLPLKSIYYISFIVFIVMPILIVLVMSLMVLKRQFEKQAIENIKRAQETVIADLKSDKDDMSIRLSHMIYTNDNEILRYAAETGTQDLTVKNAYEKKLSDAVNLVLPPIVDIISVNFFMKDGGETYIKNEIIYPKEEIKNRNWYHDALKNRNTVYVGFFDTKSTNDVYMGSRKDTLILVFALAPDVSTDRAQKIEMVLYYQASSASERIKENNKNYLEGKNKLGITKIIDDEDKEIFSTQGSSDFSAETYTSIKSPVKFNHTVYYVVNDIKTSELTKDYWEIAFFVLVAASLVLLLAGYYSRYFLKSIVKPIEEISNGLREIEEGNLNVYVAVKGQYEIRTMIHQFNAMVRRVKALMEEYEEKFRSAEKSPTDYFASMIKGEITAEEVNKESKEFFLESYAILGLYIESSRQQEREESYSAKLIKSFERNPRFTSRCILYRDSSDFLLILYRITENDYTHKILSMVEDLQRTANQEYGIQIFACIGQKKAGFTEFDKEIKQIRECVCLRHLKGNKSILDLNKEREISNRLIALSKQYKALASALYTADIKNMVWEKERMFELFEKSDNLQEIVMQIYGAVLAIGNCFTNNNSDFTDIFGQKYDYFDKIGNLPDARSMKLWVANYFSWIMDYSASKLNESINDPIINAKRYIADNYENAELSLQQVAEYVGLNEKYLTNKFTKSTGETLSSYITELRIQKAQELLKTTNFKVYEISEMVGYCNVEHFNRMFKKVSKMSPIQYRKAHNVTN